MSHDRHCSVTENTFLLFRVVGETLSTVPGDRRCFRLIGGVLVERTVKEVAPALTANQEKV